MIITTELGIAPLQNVSHAWEALETAMNRPEHLPGMVALYGPSGVGKSMAAAWCANKSRAYYVELKSTWSKKAMLMAMQREMGMPPAKTIYEAVDQISEELALSNRPLIVDEADYLVEKNNVEVIRDIYEASHAAILLIGEEALPQKLAKWERFHNRILKWMPAKLCSIDDALSLSKIYAPIAWDEPMLLEIIKQSHGITRRVAVNLHEQAAQAAANGWDVVTIKLWGKRGFYTGSPAPRGR